MIDKFYIKPSDINRFWSKVDIFDCYSTDEDCWLWIASCDTKGYGVFVFRNFLVRAHRFIYVAYKGNIPDELVISHKCDCPKCVNPNHLFAVSQRNNVYQAYKRKRIVIHGENSNSAKLLDREVKEVKLMWDSGKYLQKEIASKFKVTQSHVSQLVNDNSRCSKVEDLLVYENLN